MKKHIIIAVLAVLGCVCASQAIDKYFFASGSDTATAVITKGKGTLVAKDVLMHVATNNTATIWRGKVSAQASAASTGTTIIIPTDTSNTVDGVTITTSDWVIVGDALRDISALGPASATSTTVTVTSAATVLLNEPVYICDAGDKVTLYTDTTLVQPIPFLFQGFKDAPAAVVIDAGAGACSVSGRAELQ